MSERQNVDGGLFVTRLLIGAVFVVTAYWKFTELEQLVEFLDGRNFPAPEVFAWVVAIVEFVGGLALITGLRPRLVAIGMSGYLVVATLLMHLDIGDPQQLIHLLKNLGIIGGLVAIYSAPSRKFQMMPDTM